MYLKKLVIQGFKSFADKTALHFDAGITCIVGPNGCGKSNISDAFRWVLGEQSAKSMRGLKMPDIIFAGSNTRKPLNFAEVSLTLADVNGALPIDYEEITITRRLDRSGESEYLLNGNSVRLKDLQGLFLGSGVGRNAFSIFEQGKLDKVISDTPFERRHIFEEAAGILRFLQRKKETIKRLEQVDLNLSRVQDIYSEVEKQKQTLQKQAEKARIYKEQKSLLENLEKFCYVLKWESMHKKHSDLQSKQVIHQQLLDQHQQEFLEIQSVWQKSKDCKLDHEKGLHLHKEKLFISKAQKDIQERECHSLEQRIKELQQKKRKLFLELEELTLNGQTRQSTLAELDSQKKELEGKWKEAEVHWNEQQERVKLQEKEVVELRRGVGLKQQSFLSCLKENNELQSEIKQIEIRLENLSREIKQIDLRSQELKMESQQFIEAIKGKKQLLKQLSDLIDSHKDRLEQYEDDFKKLIQEGEKKQKELEILRRKAMEMKARQKVLVRMRDEFEGFSSGSKRLLQESQDPQSCFYQLLRPLYEFIKPEAEAVEALAIVLRNYVQTLVVTHTATFKKIIAFANQEKLKDYSLLCIEWLSNERVLPISKKPSLQEKAVSNMISQHFLQSIYMCSAYDQGIEYSLQGMSQEGWCQDGSYIDHRGVYFKISPNENQVFMRESELVLLEEELLKEHDQIEKLEQAMQHFQHRRAHMQLERTELDQVLRRDEMKLVEVNFGLQRSLMDQEKNKSDQTKCQEETEKLKQGFDQQKQSHFLLEQKFEKKQFELMELQQCKEDLQEKLVNQEELLQEEVRIQKDRGIAFQETADQRQRILHQSNLLEVKEQEHGKNVLRIEEESFELNEQLFGFQAAETKVSQALVSLELEGKEMESQYEEMKKHDQLLLSQAEKHSHELALQENLLKRFEMEFSHLQIQLAHHASTSESIANDLMGHYQLTVEGAKQLTAGIALSLDQTEKQVKALRQILQESGDVNLSAIEDLEKHELRVAFLSQQLEDMLQSKNELLKVIDELDRESYKLFEETFQAIRVNFKKNFQILFNGGEADLQFIDSKDILEAGIDITAKPPGKQMRSISLLSGGEKCLTAVALLFAIFEVKPAPFCILDEIDAPLDDSNIERFINVVKHFVDRCQFLIITHNKRTMAIGDILFGVSMEERGVSKLLTLEFAKNQSMEPSFAV